MTDKSVTPAQDAIIRAEIAAFCHAQGAEPADAGQMGNLWGFGEVPAVAHDPTGRWWTFLRCLAGPTGLDETELAWLWDSEYSHPEWPRNATLTVPHSTIPNLAISVQLIHFDAVEHLFLHHSPWRDEYRRNLETAAELLTQNADHEAIARAMGAGPRPPDA